VGRGERKEGKRESRKFLGERSKKSHFCFGFGRACGPGATEIAKIPVSLSSLVLFIVSLGGRDDQASTLKGRLWGPVRGGIVPPISLAEGALHRGDSASPRFALPVAERSAALFPPRRSQEVTRAPTDAQSDGSRKKNDASAQRQPRPRNWPGEGNSKCCSPMQGAPAAGGEPMGSCSICGLSSPIRANSRRGNVPASPDAGPGPPTIGALGMPVTRGPCGGRGAINSSPWAYPSNLLCLGCFAFVVCLFWPGAPASRRYNPVFRLPP